MPLSKLFVLCSIASFVAATTNSLPSNALKALESQKDLSFITSLVKRDPVLVKLYTEAKDVTIIAANDSAFAGTTIDDYPFSNISLSRMALQFFVQHGQYTLDDFTPTPKYVPSKLTNSTYVNLSRGNQPTKLVEVDGKKIAYLGSGIPSPITKGNLRFQGGILHKTVNQIVSVFTIKRLQIVPRNDFYAITNLSSYGLLDKLSETKDITLFTVTNEAWDKIINQRICLSSLKSIPDILEYYATVGNVYYGNSFTGKSVKTLNGESVTLAGYPSNNFTVNNVKVVFSDVTTINGVVHVLERYVGINHDAGTDLARLNYPADRAFFSPIFPKDNKPSFS